MTGTVVIGVGNPMRGDDGAGPAAVEALREQGIDAVALDGEPARLLEAWAGADLAVVVDAAVGLEAGRVCSIELVRDGAVVARPGRPRGAAGTHGAGLAEAVALGEVLDRLPDRLVVCAVGAAETGDGPGLSPAVAAALDDLVAAVRSVAVDRRA